MTTLYLVTGMVVILIGLIYAMARLVEKETEARHEADSARASLSAMERFNETMRRPLFIGSNLVRDLRARVSASRTGDGTGVPDPKDEDD